MWIVKTKYVDEKGMFTKEEETAVDEFWAGYKYKSTLNRWKDILCRRVILHPTALGVADNVEIILKTIQFNLKLLNNGSSFEISMEEIQEDA